MVVEWNVRPAQGNPPVYGNAVFERLFCMGDYYFITNSNDDMFEAVASSVSDHSLPDTAELFACTVGQKPSMAKYYLDDTFDVIKMLEGLSAVSAQQVTSPKPHNVVTFEGSV